MSSRRTDTDTEMHTAIDNQNPTKILIKCPTYIILTGAELVCCGPKKNRCSERLPNVAFLACIHACGH